MNGCTCSAELAWLRSSAVPSYGGGPNPVRLADLFCGCGGMSLGIAEAARRGGRGATVALAADVSSDAVAAYKLNFPGALIQEVEVESLFDGSMHGPLTPSETWLRKQAGRVDFLLGGPPCQGHSSLNNHTRSADPRNDLYARMARAAEVLRAKVVIIENVPSVSRDASNVVGTTRDALEAAGYDVAEAVVDLSTLGVPQRRRRHVMLATWGESGMSAATILKSLSLGCPRHPERSVGWAIGDLMAAKPTCELDRPTKLTVENIRRIRWLFDHDAYDLPNRERPTCHRGDHKYQSMYGRMRWDEPAPTVTTGFGSMGQGRYVHPKRHRMITPREAARLQMIPDFMRFPEGIGRGTLATMIGNAVPPPLSLALGLALIPALSESRPIARVWQWIVESFKATLGRMPRLIRGDRPPSGGKPISSTA